MEIQKINLPTQEHVQKLSEKIKKRTGIVIRAQLAEMFLLFFPVALFIIFLFLSYYLYLLRYQMYAKQLAPLPFKTTPLASYPQLQENFLPQILPSLSARSALIMDDESKVVLFSKNTHLRFSIASTTKIMTALVALEYFHPDDLLTIKSENVGPVVVEFKKNEQVRFIDLLYAMLLPSANDAALAISQNYPGGETAFVAGMNQKAQELKLYNTHFGDSIGFLDEQNYSTALDLARLTGVALKNKTIAEIVGTKEKVITTSNGSYTLVNLNKLLGYEGINGVKTGFTEEAGGVLVTSRTQDDHRQIVVVMGSEDRFLDTQRLVALIAHNVVYKSF